MTYRKRITNKSGVVGVCWDNRVKKWRARITAKGEELHLGMFKHKKDAIAARKAAELEHNISWRPIVILPDIPGMKLIELTKGRIACVDTNLFEWLNQWNWCYERKGYAQRSTPTIQMHVEIMKHVGRWESNLDIDHKNGCSCDNRLENLRAATRGQNNGNSALASNSTSRVTGVSWAKGNQKWESHITLDDVKKYLGGFTEKADAIAARHAAEIEYFGEFRHNPLLLCPLWNSVCPNCVARAKTLIAAGLTPTTRIPAKLDHEAISHAALALADDFA